MKRSVKGLHHPKIKGGLSGGRSARSSTAKAFDERRQTANDEA